MLVWSEDFSTGFALVDIQHRTLIDKINQLEHLLNGPPPPKQRYDEILAFLGSYAGTHFRFEEQCMEKANCPAYERNKQAHTAFLRIFARFKERYAAEGPKPELLKSIQNAAADWIRNHILTVDRELKGCYSR